MGRKKLVFVALLGYALGSLSMLIGFLISKPDTWEGCYQPCFTSKSATNATTAKALCVTKCAAEDANDGSHFHGEAFYVISQALIGMCSPFAVVASSFIVDVSLDYNSFVANYARMRAYGYAAGLGLGYLWGTVALVVFLAVLQNSRGFLVA